MSTIEEILNAAKSLPLKDQAELRRRLDRLGTVSDESEQVGNETSQEAIDLDQRIQRALYEAGLVTEVKLPITDPTPYRREPIAIKGKPLSETVIEERR